MAEVAWEEPLRVLAPGRALAVAQRSEATKVRTSLVSVLHI